MVLGTAEGLRSGLRVFNSFAGGRWVERGGALRDILNPATGQRLGAVETGPLDWAGAFHHARTVGVPSLRQLSLDDRASRLAGIAKIFSASRTRLLEESTRVGGKTYQDAKADVDGAALVYQHYADLGRALASGAGRSGAVPFPIQGNLKYVGATVIIEDGQIRIVPDSGVGKLTLDRGDSSVSLLIDAFNFPAWGPHHKAAAALLAGTPVISKPATITSPVGHLLMQLIVDSGVLPEGAFQLVMGPMEEAAYQVFEAGDVLAFTGSGGNARTLRENPLLAPRGVRLNIERDSVNAIVLAEDVPVDSPVYRMFVRHAAQETAENNKGERCTAPRKLIVLGDEERVRRVATDIAEAMRSITVGNPADGNDVKMGPLASEQQLADGLGGLRLALMEGARVLFGTDGAAVQNWHQGAPRTGGFFAGPVLLEAPNASAARYHEEEIFGPFPILMRAGDLGAGIELTARGGPKLVTAVYTNNVETARRFIAGTAPTHGRVLVVDDHAVSDTPVGKFGSGTPWPDLLHGTPGEGVELGGLRGLTLFTGDTIEPGSDIHGSGRFFRQLLR